MINDELRALRETVLFATLPHVAFEGWSERALRHGLADAGLAPPMAALAFPGGAREMIALWSRWSDERMAELVAQADLTQERLPGRLAHAVRERLMLNADAKEAVRRTVAYLALPTEVPTAARLTYDTVSALWYAVGDRATDTSFYTKRALLAAIYAATTLYWLDDRSEDGADTWGFLERRLNDALILPRWRRRARHARDVALAPWRWLGPRRTAT